MIPKNLIWTTLDATHRLPGGQDPAFGKIGRGQAWDRYWREHRR